MSEVVFCASKSKFDNCYQSNNAQFCDCIFSLEDIAISTHISKTRERNSKLPVSLKTLLFLSSSVDNLIFHISVNTSVPHHISHIFVICRSTGHWAIWFLTWKQNSDLNKTSYFSVIPIILTCIKKKKFKMATVSSKLFLTILKHTSLFFFAGYYDLSHTVWENSWLNWFFLQISYFLCSRT